MKLLISYEQNFGIIKDDKRMIHIYNSKYKMMKRYWMKRREHFQSDIGVSFF